MKSPLVILAFALGMGVSFAVGGYFGPQLFRATPVPDRFSSVKLALPAPDHTAAASPSGARAASSSPGNLEAILAETNSYHLLKNLTAYADGISAADMPEAIEKTQSLTQNPKQSQALAILAGRWGELDPKAALAEAHKTQNRNMGASLVTEVF